MDNTTTKGETLLVILGMVFLLMIYIMNPTELG